MKKLLLLALLQVIILTAPAQLTSDKPVDIAGTDPEEASLAKEKITGSFEMNYMRHYIWRGISFGNNDVAQPELELKYKDFSLVLCQNFNYRPSKVPKELYSRNTFFDEQDVTIAYSKEWGKFSTEFSAMAYFYFFQPTSPNTAELYNYTVYDLKKGFSLFAENSVDFASYKGAHYLNTGLLYSRFFKNNIEVELTGFAGIANKRFNDTYFYTPNGGLNLVGSSVNITKNIKNYFIGLYAEKNWYANKYIIEANEINGTANFKLAAGFNF